MIVQLVKNRQSSFENIQDRNLTRITGLGIDIIGRDQWQLKSRHVSMEINIPLLGKDGGNRLSGSLVSACSTISLMLTFLSDLTS
jgi:hypothetical protein